MFLRWYRKKIAEAVEVKMCYMATCPNEQDSILSIIAPKDYKPKGVSHLTQTAGTKHVVPIALTRKVDLMELQAYESTSKFRKMSTVEFCEYMDIDLLPYQKLLLYLLDAKYYFKKDWPIRPFGLDRKIWWN